MLLNTLFAWVFICLKSNAPNVVRVALWTLWAVPLIHHPFSEDSDSSADSLDRLDPSDSSSPELIDEHIEVLSVL